MCDLTRLAYVVDHLEFIEYVRRLRKLKQLLGRGVIAASNI